MKPFSVHPGRRFQDESRTQKAVLGILYSIVKRESGILAHTYIFWVLGISFLVIIPFHLPVSSGRKGNGQGGHIWQEEYSSLSAAQRSS
ncbi:MAG: hypothetical protein PHG20_01080 [Geobacteraceae bacterium]|nr:hypothetical protein [Geobacteraceae bacterium]